MKRWFKRSLSLALVTVMVMGLTACGGKDETDQSQGEYHFRYCLFRK